MADPNDNFNEEYGLSSQRNKKSFESILDDYIIPKRLIYANSLIKSLKDKKYSWEIEGKKLWLVSTLAKKELKDKPDYYKNLTKKFPVEIVSPFEEIIKLDLHRTFPTDEYFRNEKTLAKLKNILLAYSRRNVTLGYCQGFNFIVGRIMKVVDNEEEIFWIFCQIIENLLPVNYFSEMLGLLTDASIVISFIESYLPDLHKHLIDVGFELHLNNLLYKWFLALFIQNIPYELSLIIWDILFLEGTIILFKAALGILKVMKKDLMKIDNVEELNDYFEKREFSFHDISEVVYFLLLRRFEFDNSLINRLRKTHEKKIMKEMNYYSSIYLIEQQIKFEEDLKSKKLLEGDLSRNSCLGISEKCNINWPLCIYDKFFKMNLINFLVFRTADDVNIIADYFYSKKPNGISEETPFKITDSTEFGKNKKKLDSFNESSNNKKAGKTELNLTKVYLSNSNFTLKNLNFEDNPGNQKDILDHDTSEDIDLTNNMSSLKYSTPKRKKKNSTAYADPYRAPNISNLDLNNLLKKEDNIDLQKDMNIAFDRHDDLIQNKNEIIFVDNKSDESNEDDNDSIAQDNLCLLVMKDDDLIEATEREEEEEKEENTNYFFNDLSFDNKRNSINKKINNFVLLESEECIDRKNNFLLNCSSSKHLNGKTQDDSNKRSHSNELKKIKDIKRENEKRIKIYRSLLINRRKHYCQIINSISDNRITFSNSKESRFLTAEINKQREEIFERINGNNINIINPFIENPKIFDVSAKISRLQKSIHEKRNNFNRSLSLIKSNIPDSIKSPNIERYSKVLSSMRSTFSNKMMENKIINFTPKPFTENEI